MKPLLVLVLCSAGLAHAQSIQKCVDATGKVLYQDTPCDAKARTAGEIRRDKSAADPVSVQRAAAERARSDSFAAAREREYQAEQERLARIEEAKAQAQAEAEAQDRLARAIAAQMQPSNPAYVPAAPIVIQDRTTINNRIVLPATPRAPTPPPPTFSGAVPQQQKK